MCHRRKAELGADALAILLEEPTSELGPVVRNDTVWDPKSTDNRLEEGNNSTLGDVDHRGETYLARQMSVGRIPPAGWQNAPALILR
jgi:hypothetical protein